MGVPSDDPAQHKFLEARTFTESLCQNLEIEDFVVQSHPDVSPPKWHLAHTTWFFEKFVLEFINPNYTPFNPSYNVLFNSYYKSLGPHWKQSERGHLSRPTVKEILTYRKEITQKVIDVLQKHSGHPEYQNLLLNLEIGINHEQQHQELLLMDIKRNFSLSISNIQYSKGSAKISEHIPQKYIELPGGEYSIGTNQKSPFRFDNETPKHKTYLNGSRISNRLVTNSDFAEFIDTGGYKNYSYWQSVGWDLIQKEDLSSPLYWVKKENDWYEKSLYGIQKLDPNAPVSHVSHFEAEAFAEWSGKRLPTEEEWEIASQTHGNSNGQFCDSRDLSPTSSLSENCISNLFGTLWEWTSSSYSAYPGYRRPKGAIGEYNAKFMSGQYVLRGGSFATPRSHFRNTYRNFYYPHQRWMFSGIRLAEDL